MLKLFKQRGGGQPELLERNDIPDLLAQWRPYKKSGFKKPHEIVTGLEKLPKEIKK